MLIENYFDHASTTLVPEAVLAEMAPYFGSEFGNPNSLHAAGRLAHGAVERARERLAAALGVASESIIFTSGSTEGNNTVVRGIPHLAISPFEHSSLHEYGIAHRLPRLPSRGFDILAIDDAFTAISLMAANNETGTRWDAGQFARPGRLIHSDITQLAAKYEYSASGIDFASLSAHKFGGPKGVGALICTNFPLPALLVGGEQESRSRGGTLNVPSIVGMGLAATLAAEGRESYALQMSELQAAFLTALSATQVPFIVNGGPNRIPNILSLSFENVEGESIVIEADSLGFAISAGAACSSGSNEPSHVLAAAGCDPVFIRGSIRVSFGLGNTVESTKRLAQAVAKIVHTLQSLWLVVD